MGAVVSIQGFIDQLWCDYHRRAAPEFVDCYDRARLAFPGIVHPTEAEAMAALAGPRPVRERGEDARFLAVLRGYFGGAAAVDFDAAFIHACAAFPQQRPPSMVVAMRAVMGLRPDCDRPDCDRPVDAARRARLAFQGRAFQGRGACDPVTSHLPEPVRPGRIAPERRTPQTMEDGR